MTGTKKHWENVYTGKTPSEVSWYQQKPELSLKLIDAIGLNPESPVIDVGGGASTLVDALHQVGYSNIAVLDLSVQALTHARSRLGSVAAEVEWYEADITAFDPPHRFKLWHDRAVFHFLTDATDRARYVSTLKQTLFPGGHVIIMTFALDGPRKCSGLDIVRYDAEKLHSELGQSFELLDTGVDVHLTPFGGKQNFAWFHLVHGS